MIIFSIIFSSGIPDQGLVAEPHVLITDHGALACIDIDSTGEPISAWYSADPSDEGVFVMTDERNLFGCTQTNLVGIHEADTEGDLATVWSVLGELRRQGLNCPLTCGD